MRIRTMAMLVVVLFIGCSKDSQTKTDKAVAQPGSQMPTPEPDAVMKNSWAQFVVKSKEKIPKAIRDSKGKLEHDVEIVWTSDDVIKTASIKYPYEGSIRIKSMHIFPTWRSERETKMRFVCEGDKWVLLDGVEIKGAQKWEFKQYRQIYFNSMFED